MLTLFFTIVFLAELIVASWIISKIRIADECVQKLNTQIVEFQPILKNHLIKVKEVAEILHTKLNCLIKAVVDKKENCEKILKHKALAEFGLWVLNLPYKKIISIIEILLTIRKFLKWGKV